MRAGSRQPHWIAALLIVLCASWVQFTTALETHVPVPSRPDSGSYVSYAYNLREFGVYSRARTWQQETPSKPVADTVSPPGYPLFLVPFLDGRPDFDFLGRVVKVQALFGTLTALVVFLLGMRIAGLASGTAAGLLTALTPHLATINTYLLTESLFTLLLALSMLSLAWALERRSRWRWACVGLMFGMACLVRPTLEAVVPIAAIAAIVAPGRRERLRSPAWMAALVWLALLLPWFAYKQSVPPAPDQPDLFRATLYHGSFPDFRYGDHPSAHGMPYRDDPFATESMASTSGLLHHFGQRAAADPARYVRWYLIGKPASFLAWDNTAGGEGDAFLYAVDASPWLDRTGFRVLHALMHGLHAPLMVAGVFAAIIGAFWPAWFRLPCDERPLRMLAALLLATVLFHMIGAPYPRYGIPFWPLLYVLALLPLKRVFEDVLAKRRLAQAGHGAATRTE